MELEKKYFGLLLLIFEFVCRILCQENSLPVGSYQCYLRCTAKCLTESLLGLDACKLQCESLNTEDLCDNDECWGNCGGFFSTSGAVPSAPRNLRASYSKPNPNPAMAELRWTSVPKASLYIVQFRNSHNWRTHKEVAGSPSSSQFTELQKEDICGLYQFRVAAVNSNGISLPSNIAYLKRASPATQRDTILEKAYLRYTSKTWFFENGQLADNETVELGLHFTPPHGWALSDLEAEMIVHPYHCANYEIGLGRALPQSVYELDTDLPIIHVKIPGTFSRENCQFFFKLLEFKSKKCGTKAQTDIPVLNMKINCDTVSGSPCKIPKNRSPTCGFTDFSFEVMERNDDGRVSARVSWRPLHVSRRVPVLYYALRWGEGEPLLVTGLEEVDRFFSHLVSIGTISGQTRTCGARNSTCDSMKHTATIPNLRRNTLYGIQICAVYDRNEEFPEDRELKTLQSHKLKIQKR